MDKLFIKTVVIIFFSSTLFGKISEPKKITGPTSIKAEINRIEIALTGGFTQAFESKNLLTFPPTEENFDKWQQAMIETQKSIAKNASKLKQFIDPLMDVNNTLKQTFMKLRNSSINKTTANSILGPLKITQLNKIKDQFEQYQKKSQSRFQKIKNTLKKAITDTKESDFYPLITRIIMSLEILIGRMCTKDLKNI